MIESIRKDCIGRTISTYVTIELILDKRPNDFESRDCNLFENDISFDGAEIHKSIRDLLMQTH